MPEKTIPTKSWQFYHACKHHLGVATITQLFKVSPRQVDRWACDPDFAESSQRNPMDRYEALLRGLMERGAVGIARAVVDRQARITGCSLVEDEPVTPDKATLADECLDDLPALADYHLAMRNNAPIQVIRDLCRQAKREIDESLAMYESQGNCK